MTLNKQKSISNVLKPSNSRSLVLNMFLLQQATNSNLALIHKALGDFEQAKE